MTPNFRKQQKHVCSRQKWASNKRIFLRKRHSHLKRVLSFSVCLMWAYPVLTKRIFVCVLFLVILRSLWPWALWWCIISAEGRVCLMMDDSAHSEGDSSSVTVELTEVTLPVASCLKVPFKKESGYDMTCTLFLECGWPCHKNLR